MVLSSEGAAKERIMGWALQTMHRQGLANACNCVALEALKIIRRYNQKLTAP